MAQRIDPETIGYVAALGKLYLTEEEEARAAKDLQQMLDYIDKLEELDTTGVTPMVQVLPLENVFREDAVTNEDAHDAMLANAPQREDDQFVVPITIG